MRFIHLSTDYVLDGRREGLKTEEGKCRPVNVYGESKLEAEFRVREEMPDALVARVSWVFGNPGRPSFLEMVLRRAMKREPLAAVADKWSMPTWVEIAGGSVSWPMKATRPAWHTCASPGNLSPGTVMP
ncbi:MAG: sugar nucleotide-binding protein [Akkermansia sp.]